MHGCQEVLPCGRPPAYLPCGPRCALSRTRSSLGGSPRDEGPQLLFRNVQRFRDGLVFKAHRLCASLNSRLESNKEETPSSSAGSPRDDGPPRRKVDVRVPGKGNSNSHGARPVHPIITMIKWIRTCRFSIKNSLSVRRSSSFWRRRTWTTRGPSPSRTYTLNPKP